MAVNKLVIDVDYKKAICFLIDDGLITKEQAQSAVNRVKALVTQAKRDTASWQAAERLCSMMNELIDQNGRKMFRPNLQNVNAMEMLVRLDKHSEDEIAGVIHWAMSDDFWHQVILSPINLRKHFDKLKAKRELLEGKREVIINTSPAKSYYEMVEEAEERTRNSVPMPKGFKESLRKAQ
jgi:hypothetical protein